MSDRFSGGLENIDGDLTAGEALSAGDAVGISADDTVSTVSTNGDQAYGVVLYDAANGDPVAVATVGAKVVVGAQSGVSAGDPVFARTDGTVDAADAAADSENAVLGVATVGHSSGEATILIGAGGDFNSS